MNYFKLLLSVILITFLVFFYRCQDEAFPDYRALIDAGKFRQAENIINQVLEQNHDLSEEERFALTFEIERMARIRKDFSKSEQEVVDFIKKYIPDVSAEDLKRWEQEKSLEYKIIDGQKMYFNRAARNLFRLDDKSRQIWHAYHEQEKRTDQSEQFDIHRYAEQVREQVTKNNKNYVKPVRIKIHYSLTVKPDIVPQDEMIRCWIPYPREIDNRQTDIKLINAYPASYQIAPENALQRTIYFEQPSKGSQPTEFSVAYEFTNRAVFYDISADNIDAVPANGDMERYLQEEPPHIVFTDEMRELSAQIMADEQNSYRKAQIIFEWVYNNTPWASAREYSTIRSLSRYGFEMGHGDCGIQSMLFTTLCRLNGIPSKWQSGWSFKHPADTMHDWAMIYFAPHGWIPMDPYCGPLSAEDDKIKYFYLTGIDAYRLVFNDAYSQAFSPAKQYHRSETIDSQRGEVEWAGGNLYFDQWLWNMDWQILSE